MKTAFQIVFFFTAGLFISCAEKKGNVSVLKKGGTQSSVSAEESSLYILPAGIDAEELNKPTQLWHVSKKRICILFGYGYNFAEEESAILEPLAARYGLSANDGLILPLVYPTDFTQGKNNYADELCDKIESYDIEGIILLGAPQNTHISLAYIDDDYNGTAPFPVFSFFPQDDPAGMECAADFVIDCAHDPDEQKKDEAQTVTVYDMPQIVLSAVRYMLLPGNALTRDNKLPVHVQAIFGKRKVTRYVDAETGLLSINHFILN